MISQAKQEQSASPSYDPGVNFFSVWRHDPERRGVVTVKYDVRGGPWYEMGGFDHYHRLPFYTIHHHPLPSFACKNWLNVGVKN